MCSSLRTIVPFSIWPLALAALFTGGCVDTDLNAPTSDTNAGGTGTADSQPGHNVGGSPTPKNTLEPTLMGGSFATAGDSAKPQPNNEVGRGGANSGSQNQQRGGSASSVATSASGGSAGSSTQASSSTTPAGSVLLPDKTIQVRAGIADLTRTQAVYSLGSGNLAAMGVAWRADLKEYRLYTGAGVDAKAVNLNARTTDPAMYALTGTETGWAVAYWGTNQDVDRGSSLHLDYVGLDGKVSKKAVLGLDSPPRGLDVAVYGIERAGVTTAMVHDDKLVLCDDAACSSQLLPPCAGTANPTKVLDSEDGFVLARTCERLEGKVELRWATTTRQSGWKVVEKVLTEFAPTERVRGAQPILARGAQDLYALESAGHYLFVDDQGNALAPRITEAASDVVGLVPRGTRFLELRKRAVSQGDEDWVEADMRFIEPGAPLPPFRKVAGLQVRTVARNVFAAPSYNNETGQTTLAIDGILTDLDEENGTAANQRRIGPSAGYFTSPPRCDIRGCSVAFTYNASTGNPYNHESEVQLLASDVAATVAHCNHCNLLSPLATGEIVRRDNDLLQFSTREGRYQWAQELSCDGSDISAPIAMDSDRATFLCSHDDFAVVTAARDDTGSEAHTTRPPPASDTLDCGSTWFYLSYGEAGAALYDPSATADAKPNIRIPKASGLEPVRCAGTQIFTATWISAPETDSGDYLGTSFLRRVSIDSTPLSTVTVPGAIGRITAEGDTLWILTYARSDKRYHLEGIRPDGSREAIRDIELPAAANNVDIDVTPGRLHVAWSTAIGLFLSSYQLK